MRAKTSRLSRIASDSTARRGLADALHDGDRLARQTAQCEQITVSHGESESVIAFHRGAGVRMIVFENDWCAIEGSPKGRSAHDNLDLDRNGRSGRVVRGAQLASDA